MTPFTVRDATAADAERLAAWNTAMALETEGEHLDPPTIRAGVSRLLADGDLGRAFVVSSADGTPVGTLMVTREWSDWRNGLFWWIQSVYVTPEARGAGAFTALYEHVETLARSQPDVIGLRLYVERENTRAQATYRARGMHETAYRLYEVTWCA